MSRYLRNELYKIIKNKYIWLFFLTILVSHIIKVFQMGMVSINPPSFALMAIPEAFLFVILFVVYISSYLIATDYQKGTLKLPIIIGGERSKVFLSKFLTATVGIFTIILFNIISAYLIGEIFLKTGSEIMYNGELLYIRGKQLEGMYGFAVIFLGTLTAILPALTLTQLLMFLAFFLRNSNVVFGIGAAYYILSLTIPKKLKIFFVTNYMYKLPAFFIRGEIVYNQSVQMIIVSIISTIILYCINIWYFKKMDIHS